MNKAANQLAISTTKQPIQSVTQSTPNSSTSPEETFFKWKHNANDIQSDVIVAEKENLNWKWNTLRLKWRKFLLKLKSWSWKRSPCIQITHFSLIPRNSCIFKIWTLRESVLQSILCKWINGVTYLLNVEF